MIRRDRWWEREAGDVLAIISLGAFAALVALAAILIIDN